MVNKLITLVLILSVSWTVSLGQGTKTTTTDSLVCLPKAVAKANAVELLQKDSLANELKVAKNNIEVYKKNEKLKDSLLSVKNAVIEIEKEKNSSYVNIIQLKDQQLSNSNDAVKKLNKDNKKLKVQNTVGRVTNIALVVLAVVLIFK